MAKVQSGKRLVRAWGPFVIAGIILLLAPLVLSDFRLNLLGKFLTFAIMALGLDLIWGYGGMLSLGQGLFFIKTGYLDKELHRRKILQYLYGGVQSKVPGPWDRPFHPPQCLLRRTGAEAPVRLR